MKCCEHKFMKRWCECHHCWGTGCDVAKPIRKGKITCANCKVPVTTGTQIKLMFCPNKECINSEDNYLN